MKKRHKSSLANTYQARHQGIAPNGRSLCLFNQGPQEVARVDSCYRAAGCRPTCRHCIIQNCDPDESSFLDFDGQRPSVYDFEPRYQHLFHTDGVSSTNPCCLCRPKTSCPDPRTCDELLESVAVAQRALAQILNAEGEKLKRIIVSTNDINTLLEANRAINRTLVEVTFMEQALCHKLELIQEICHVCEGCLPETEAQK